MIIDHLIALPILVAGLATGLAASLGLSAGAPDPRQEPEWQLFHGGVFHTGSFKDDGTERIAQALLVQRGRIVGVGDFAELSQQEAARGATRTDFGGAHVFPGFQDAHGDLLELGKSLEVVDLVGCDSYDEVIARVQHAASELPEGEWIEGRGWDQARFEGKAFPRHDSLSKAVPRHPVWLARIGGQAGLANRAAMELSGVLKDDFAPKLVGGEVLRDERGPTGVFLDGAMSIVETQIPGASREVRARRLLRAQDLLLSLGVTCVHQIGAAQDGLESLVEVSESGQLVLRVVAYPDAPPASELEALVELREAVAAHAEGRGPLVIRGVFFQLDGGLGSRGAALLADYADQPKHRGRALPDVFRFSEQVEQAARLGFQPAVHAVGDAAVRHALDAFKLVASRADGLAAIRPRIEHMQLVDAGDLARFKDFGVVSSMQPAHVASDQSFVDARLGPDRAGRSYAWRSVRDGSGGVLAFGSAFPAASPDPRVGLHAALTRQTIGGAPKGGFHPEERLAAHPAIEAYTQGAAAAALQENERGRLARGYACDLTAYAEDVSQSTAASAHSLLNAKVVATVVNGRVAFHAK